MKKVLFHVLAAVIILSGCAVAYFALTHRETIEKPKPPINNHDAIRRQKELLTFTKSASTWEGRVNDDGSPRDFDLFTCPQVTKKNGKFIKKSYDELIIDDTLPLFLYEIRKKPYRLQLEGYSVDKATVNVMFRDSVTGEIGECLVNEGSHPLKIYVESFQMKTVEKYGIPYEVPFVRIYDETTKTYLELTNEQKFLDDQYIVIIHDLQGQEYTFMDAGDSVKIGELTCILRSFNKQNNTAKILIRDALEQEFHKTLRAIR